MRLLVLNWRIEFLVVEQQEQADSPLACGACSPLRSVLDREDLVDVDAAGGEGRQRRVCGMAQRDPDRDDLIGSDPHGLAHLVRVHDQGVGVDSAKALVAAARTSMAEKAPRSWKDHGVDSTGIVTYRAA